MATEGGELGMLVGTLVIILAMTGYIYFAGLRSSDSGGSKKDDGPSVNPMLSRFVVHDGSVIGEVLAIDEGQLVVKRQGKYQVFEASQATLKNDEVHLLGDIDFAAASTAGEAWLAANRKGQDDAITAHLTTSADIKKPAREAFDQANDSEEE